LHHRLGEEHAGAGDEDAEQERRGDGGARHLLHLGDVPGAIGLPDQHRGARGEPDDERHQQEHDWKEGRNRRQRFDAEQLADIDAVGGARQRLQDVAQHQRQQEDEETPPERLGGGRHA
jgi:hypothetical protein